MNSHEIEFSILYQYNALKIGITLPVLMKYNRRRLILRQNSIRVPAIAFLKED
ncbi:MAG TPA: hypothetical protein VK892_06720 [Pyrinomonadaceae bacterium]|nr:hypothetical protein [Pyrinomonadaceae bacterium]